MKAYLIREVNGVYDYAAVVLPKMKFYGKNG